MLYGAGAGTSVTGGNIITGSDVGVYVYDDAGTTTVMGNDISQSDAAAIVSDGSTVSISDNNLHDNSGDGIDLYDAQNGTSITGNAIKTSTGTTSAGIYVDGTVTDSSAPLLVTNNNISGNTTGLDNESPVGINADYNYWGSSTGPTSVSNSGGTGDSIVVGSTGTVTYAPWLTTATSGAAVSITGASASKEGQTYTLTLAPSLDISSWTINWGDGTQSVPDIQTVSGNSTSVTHVFVEYGSYSVSAVAATVQGNLTSNTLTVVVTDASLNVVGGVTLTPTSGTSTGTVTVATLTDAAGTYSNPSDLSVSINWGDGITTSGSLVETGNTGVYSVEGSHTYEDEGSYTITSFVTKTGGGAADDSTTASIANVSDVAPVASISTAPGTNPAGTAISLTGTASDVGTADNAAGYTFAWTVTKNGNAFSSGGSPAGSSSTTIGFTPDDQGTYVVSLIATDHNGVSSVAATEQIVVSDVAPVASISTAPGTNPAGTAISLTGTASDVGTADNAAGYTFAWTVTKNGNAFSSGGSPAGSSSTTIGFTPDDQGTYVVSLIATDHNGVSSVAATEQIVVSDVAPVASISTAPGTNPAGTAISLTGTASDVGTADNAAGYTFAWTVTKNGNAFSSGGFTGRFIEHDDRFYT